MVIAIPFIIYCFKTEAHTLNSTVFDSCLNVSGDKQTVNVIKVNLNKVKQTIHSFGASDAWTAKFIGKWADIKKRDKIADLLFSMDTTADGNPKGIGLSLWRFNIGSGSFEQGTASNIPDEWRREECFLNKNESYDWSKQGGQQWFLQAARQRGVKYTLGFSISPPVFITKNGKAYNSETASTQMNIKDHQLAAYADFLIKVTKHFKFDFLSPVNEPQWTWGKSNGAGQEGTQAKNQEIASLVKLISKKLKETPYHIIIGEAGQWDFLYGRNEDGRGDQINQFFSPHSLNYIGNLPHVTHAISAHSYFTTCPDTNLINIRQKVANRINQIDPSLATWQTEFGILGNICGLYNGAPRNNGIDYGLYVAKVIHHDLTIANVVSWQWWLAMSPYNYSDALIYINAPSGQINVPGSKNDGEIIESKQLWALGNYSRFIRPGMKRIAAFIQGITDPVVSNDSLMISAYKDEANKKLVLVIVNPGADERILQLKGEAQPINFKDNILNAYLTNEEFNLKKTVISTSNIKISPKSIITLVGLYD
ncbi:MAG: hypothetical protein JWQ54_546 [Mucilaginibacter sp.]|nr:hypothetical protein [Mucilaginibacter sp.]